jgi:hypothetical protein
MKQQLRQSSPRSLPKSPISALPANLAPPSPPKTRSRTNSSPAEFEEAPEGLQEVLDELKAHAQETKEKADEFHVLEINRQRLLAAAKSQGC